MGRENDWFDDFMEMKMISGDEDKSNGKNMQPSSDSGCLTFLICVCAFLFIVSLFVS